MGVEICPFSLLCELALTAWHNGTVGITGVGLAGVGIAGASRGNQGSHVRHRTTDNRHRHACIDASDWRRPGRRQPQTPHTVSGVSRPVGGPDITSHPQQMQLYGLVTTSDIAST